MDRLRDAQASAVAYIAKLTPFKWAAAAFWIMLLVSVVIIGLAANSLVNTKNKPIQHALKQAQAALKNTYAVSAQAANHMTGLVASHNVTRHFLDGQYGVVVLASIVAVISLAGIISSQQVIADVTKDDPEAESGTTTMDFMWLSSLASLVFAQGIILLVIGVFMASQFASYKKMKHMTGQLKAGKVSFDATMIVQLAFGFLGLVGGIFFYSAIRVSRA